MPVIGENRKRENNNNNANEIIANKKLKHTPFLLPMPTLATVRGQAMVCGQGDMGQLGFGEDGIMECKLPKAIESVRNVVEVRAGGMHNILLTSDGTVYTFGCNDEGALGRDTSEDGSEFEPKKVYLPDKALRITAGDSHSAALLQDGQVYAWGSFRDSHGNMGLTSDGNQREPINLMANIECCDIASGADHLVILTRRGEVYTVGCAEQGQLGRISIRSSSGTGRRGKLDLLCPRPVIVRRCKPFEAIWTTNYGTFAREHQTGCIWSFGLNNYKQLCQPHSNDIVAFPRNTQLVDVLEVAGGQHHTLVLKHDNSCHTVGRFDYGRLGLGDDIKHDVTELQKIRTLNGMKIINVSCGDAQSYVITNSGKLYSWGMGSSHQLGTGKEEDILVPHLMDNNRVRGKRIIRAYGGGQHSIYLLESDSQ